MSCQISQQLLQLYGARHVGFLTTQSFEFGLIDKNWSRRGHKDTGDLAIQKTGHLLWPLSKANSLFPDFNWFSIKLTHPRSKVLCIYEANYCKESSYTFYAILQILLCHNPPPPQSSQRRISLRQFWKSTCCDCLRLVHRGRGKGTPNTSRVTCANVPIICIPSGHLYLLQICSSFYFFTSATRLGYEIPWENIKRDTTIRYVTERKKHPNIRWHQSRFRGHKWERKKLKGNNL